MLLGYGSLAEVVRCLLRATALRMDLARGLNRAEEVEKAKAQIIEFKPKAEAFDQLMNADGLYGLQNAGRSLSARPNLFIRWLKRTYLFYQGNALVPRVQFIQRGLFEVKTKIVDDIARPTTFITPKGLDFLRGKLPDELLIGGVA